MCLYLNLHVFTALDGAAEAGEILAEEVRGARRKGISMITLQECDELKGGCAFDRFFYVTPDDLIDDGLFHDIAIALFSSDKEMLVSRAYLHKKLEGKEIKSADVQHHSWY